MPDRAVLVLGNHADDAWSMRHYSRLLREAYADAGVLVEYAEPDSSLSRGVSLRPLAKLISHAENLLAFPVAVRRRARAASVIHIADHGNGAWLLWPHLRGKTIITCHDLLAVRGARGDFPEHVPDLSEKVRQRLIVRGLRKATVIHCVSETTARDVAAELPEARTEVILNPLRGPFAAPRRTGSEGAKRTRGPAVIVSGANWRKRRDFAIRAWQRLRQQPALSGIHLHVVGPPLSDDEASTLTAAEARAVHIESNLTDEELAALYCRARVLLQLSRYEGFGWPIIEAQAMGTAVLCTDGPIFREVAGDGAVFIPDDLDTVDWGHVASAIGGSELPARGTANVRRFTYEEFTGRLASLARSVASAGSMISR